MSDSAYSRLEQHLTRQIESGVWQAGAQMPTERALAREHGLSVGTVRKALDNLVRGGYCVRIQGKGTFVAEYSQEQPIFYRLRPSLDSTDAELTTRRVQLDALPMPEAAARALGLEPGARGIRVFRLIQGRQEGETFFAGCSLSWFPAWLCADLLDVDVAEFQRHPLYYLVESVCGLPVISGDELMTICSELPAEIGELVARDFPMPCFHLTMLAHSYGKRPLEFRESCILTGTRGLMRWHDFRR